MFRGYQKTIFFFPNDFQQFGQKYFLMFYLYLSPMQYVLKTDGYEIIAYNQMRPQNIRIHQCDQKDL